MPWVVHLNECVCSGKCNQCNRKVRLEVMWVIFQSVRGQSLLPPHNLGEYLSCSVLWGTPQYERKKVHFVPGLYPRQWWVWGSGSCFFSFSSLLNALHLQCLLLWQAKSLALCCFYLSPFSLEKYWKCTVSIVSNSVTIGNHLVNSWTVKSVLMSVVERKIFIPHYS